MRRQGLLGNKQPRTWSSAGHVSPIVYHLTTETGLSPAELISTSLTREKKMMMKNMHALSIRQPYAELILQGIKTIEYRSRPTHIRERVYIYTSRTPAENADAFDQLDPRLGDLPIGVLVGTVDVVGCDGSLGSYEWHLANPKRLPEQLTPERCPQPVWFYPFCSSEKQRLEAPGRSPDETMCANRTIVASIENLSRDELKKALLMSVGREWAERAKVIHAAATRLGFHRVGSRNRKAFTSAITDLICQKKLEYSKNRIRRTSNLTM